MEVVVGAAREFTDAFEALGAGVVEGVDYDYVVAAGLKEFDAGVGSNVARSARDEDRPFGGGGCV